MLTLGRGKLSREIHKFLFTRPVLPHSLFPTLGALQASRRRTRYAL